MKYHSNHDHPGLRPTSVLFRYLILNVVKIVQWKGFAFLRNTCFPIPMRMKHSILTNNHTSPGSRQHWPFTWQKKQGLELFRKSKVSYFMIEQCLKRAYQSSRQKNGCKSKSDLLWTDKAPSPIFALMPFPDVVTLTMNSSRSPWALSCYAGSCVLNVQFCLLNEGASAGHCKGEMTLKYY